MPATSQPRIAGSLSFAARRPTRYAAAIASSSRRISIITSVTPVKIIDGSVCFCIIAEIDDTVCKFSLNVLHAGGIMG